MIISTKITADLINLNPTTGYYEFNETVSGKVIFEYCGDCKKMACIPSASAFAASRRVQKTEKDMMIARCSTSTEKQQKYSNKKELFLEKYNPKYNSKMMDSIWGLYNRYSPHNFKKNNASDQQQFQEMQKTTVSFAKISIQSIGCIDLELKSKKTAHTTIKNWENLWNSPPF